MTNECYLKNMNTQDLAKELSKYVSITLSKYIDWETWLKQDSTLPTPYIGIECGYFNGKTTAKAYIIDCKNMIAGKYYKIINAENQQIMIVPDYTILSIPNSEKE